MAHADVLIEIQPPVSRYMKSNDNATEKQLSHKTTKDTTEAPDPPAFLRFDSHEDATRALVGIGYHDAVKTPAFESEVLVEHTASLLNSYGAAVMDMTTALPDTPQAAYKALTVAGVHAAAACKKDTSAAFIILRTARNTPSFLFGHHWSLSQSVGKEAADLRIKSTHTPAAIIFFRDRQVCLPSSICLSGVQIVSRLIAYLITSQADFFSCCVCHEAFADVSNDACVKVSEVGMAPCGHMFRRECALNIIQRIGRFECPECAREAIKD